MEFLTTIWKEAAWTKNAVLVPITVGIVVAVISAISTWFIKKYLKAQDAADESRHSIIVNRYASLEKKIEAFCHLNTVEHEKLNDKLVNHDHDERTGKPRFYT